MINKNELAASAFFGMLLMLLFSLEPAFSIDAIFIWLGLLVIADVLIDIRDKLK